MRKYAHPAGDTGVTGFEFGPDSITLWFADGALERYTEQDLGRARIARMKRLAVEGSGLEAFIDRHIRRSARFTTFASRQRSG